MVKPRAPLDPDDDRLRKDAPLPLFDRVEAARRAAASETAVDCGSARIVSTAGASSTPPTTLRVDRHNPKHDDGDAWKAAAIAEAKRLVNVHGYVTPSMVRAAVGEPPPPMEAQYAMGGVFAKLRAMGLQRTTEEVVSPVKSRNAARESVYRPGEGWGS